MFRAILGPQALPIGLTSLAVLSSPPGLADADPLLAVPVIGAVRDETLGLSNVAFGTLPSVDTVALPASIDAVTTTEQRTHTCKKKTRKVNKYIL